VLALIVWAGSQEAEVGVGDYGSREGHPKICAWHQWRKFPSHYSPIVWTLAVNFEVKLIASDLGMRWWVEVSHARHQAASS